MTTDEERRLAWEQEEQARHDKREQQGKGKHPVRKPKEKK